MTKDQIDYLMTGMLRAAAREAWAKNTKPTTLSLKVIRLFAMHFTMHMQELESQGVVDGWEPKNEEKTCLPNSSRN